MPESYSLLNSLVLHKANHQIVSRISVCLFSFSNPHFIVIKTLYPDVNILSRLTNGIRHYLFVF